jgi:hypothetical protein
VEKSFRSKNLGGYNGQITKLNKKYIKVHSRMSKMTSMTAYREVVKMLCCVMAVANYYFDLISINFDKIQNVPN